MATTSQTVQQLYIAYFGRPADPAGAENAAKLVNWAGNPNALLADFGKSAEYTAQFSGLTPAQTVEKIYLNLFGRSAEPTGLQFWSAKVGSGEIPLSTATWTILSGVTAGSGDSVAINSKVTYAEAFTAKLVANAAAAVAYNSSTLDMVKTEMAKIKDAATLATSNTGLDTFVSSVITGGANSGGSTFTLTTNLDNLTGTSGNDTFIGGANETQAADQVVGGSGTDTLKLYGTVTLPNFSGIEKIEFSAPGANDINLTSKTELTHVTVANNDTGNADRTYSLPTSVQQVTLKALTDTGNADNEVILGFGSAATSATLVLDNVNGGNSTAANDVEIEVEGAAIKTLNIKTENNASRVSFQDETSNGNVAVDKVVITGDKNLRVDGFAASTADKVTVDASAFTGALNFAATATEVFEVTGGSGNDRVNFGGALTTADKFDGKAGTNTVAVNTFTGAADALNAKTNNVAHFANVTTLEYTGTAAYAADVSTVTLSGLTTFSTTGAIAPGQASGNGTGAGTVGMAITGQTNARIFSIENSITGGGGQNNTSGAAASGAGATAVTFTASAPTPDNVLNLVLKGVTVKGGDGGAATAGTVTTYGVGGSAANFTDFETINITSSKAATGTATNIFVGGNAGAATTAGSGAVQANTIIVDTNAKLVVTGDNEINLGKVGSTAGNTSVQVDASALTGKLTVSTGSAVDVIKGAANINTLTLNGGGDQLDLSKSTGFADVINLASGTGITTSSFIKITGFTNSATATIGDKLDITNGTTAIQADVAAGTATGVTDLSAGVASGIMTFGGAIAATATLAQKVQAAASANFAGAVGEVVAFEHGGNTYIVAQASNANDFSDGDYLVELTGVTGLTSLSLTASAASAVWVV